MEKDLFNRATGSAMPDASVLFRRDSHTAILAWPKRKFRRTTWPFFFECLGPKTNKSQENSSPKFSHHVLTRLNKPVSLEHPTNRCINVSHCQQKTFLSYPWIDVCSVSVGAYNTMYSCPLEITHPLLDQRPPAPNLETLPSNLRKGIKVLGDKRQ